MKFQDSYMMEGWIGLFEKDEDGHPDESRTFRNVKVVEAYIKKLTIALEKYKVRKSVRR